MFLRPSLHDALRPFGKLRIVQAQGHRAGAHRDGAVSDLELVETALPKNLILPRRKNHILELSVISNL